MNPKHQNQNPECIDLEVLELEQELNLFETLSNYDVEYPGEDEISDTIEKLRVFVPEKKSNLPSFKNLRSLLTNSFNEFSQINLLFWICNILFYGLGIGAIYVVHANPYYIAILLSPIPIIIGLTEVFRSRDQGMYELEMTFKYNVYEIMFSKMVTIGLYNLILNTIFSLLLINIGHYINLWKLVLYWMTPFTAITALALYAAVKIRGQYYMPTILGGWLAFMAILSKDSFFIQLLKATNNIIFILIIIISTSYLVRQLAKMKRGVLIEIDNS